MNKSKIEWCDDTWNPVTGCLHNCPYCYARRIANRFGGYSKEMASEYQTPIQVFSSCGVIAALEHPLIKHTTNGEMIAPYPFGFDPTFHRYRLDKPARKTRPRKIFVCSMADLFGAWVPDEWIQEVFKACEAAPQHTYLFLTKNPSRFCKHYIYSQMTSINNAWIGTTITNHDDQIRTGLLPDWVPLYGDNQPKRFVSVEPLLSGLIIPFLTKINWVIIGAQTGPGAVPPKREWVESIVDQCKVASVPVFMKNSLKDLMGADFIQEWPEGLR